MGSTHFRNYVANINRIHLIEMIEACCERQNPRPFRASLIANPVTGLPYGCDMENCASEDRS